MTWFKKELKIFIRKTIKRIRYNKYMFDKNVFLMCGIVYLYTFGTPSILLDVIYKFYYVFDDFLTYFIEIIYPEYLKDEKSENNEEQSILEDIMKLPPKYEDKYLNDIRNLNKDWVFTEEENNDLPMIIKNFYNRYIDLKVEKIEEINKKIAELENEISQDTDTINFTEYCDDYGHTLVQENTLEERNEIRNLKINRFREEVNQFKSEILSEEGINKLKSQSEEEANKYIINKRLDKLKNLYIMEKTPIGNVIMIYEKDRESFKFYSDCNIPYRYLEVVGRKYVKLFNCRPIFVDMEEEVRLFEEKWEREQELKKIKEEEKNKVDANKEPVEVRKNVFAKFKSYNKDAGGKISMAAPPKNSIPNKSIHEIKENEKIILKERANRYTYEGKFANFNFLHKIERKVFNKKLAVSFADFKKMQKK
jgi:hypothetical protein